MIHGQIYIDTFCTWMQIIFVAYENCEEEQLQSDNLSGSFDCE